MFTTEGLRELMATEDYDFRYSCGVTQAVSKMELKDRDSIVQSIAKHCAIMYCMTELIQLKDGLASLKVLVSSGKCSCNPETACLLTSRHFNSMTSSKQIWPLMDLT